MINWYNPYESLGSVWLKGNLHTHTTPQSPCGRVRLERVLELYENYGYDFLAISDHLHYTEVIPHTDLSIIPGIEWNSRAKGEDIHKVKWQEHLGIYSLDSRVLQSTVEKLTPVDVLDFLEGSECLKILNHPNWLIPHHYSEEELFALYESVDGVEINNAVIDRHEGSADACMKWDRILTDKGPILGFACDDSHLESDIGRAWLMVNAEDNSAEAVLAALKAGRFYCSSGVTIKEIVRNGDTLLCSSKDDVYIELIGKNGQVMAAQNKELQFSWSNTNSPYLRFALYGSGKSRAWSQPFFRSWDIS